MTAARTCSGGLGSARGRERRAPVNALYDSLACHFPFRREQAGVLHPVEGLVEGQLYAGGPRLVVDFGGGYRDFGLGRFVHYELIGAAMVNAVPAIVPFMKHRMRGDRHVLESADRVVITWDQSEPTGGLRTPSPFPYGDGAHEGSIMGGAVYQDNGDGTFTLLDRGSMQPASGYSYLELYFIGVLAPGDVPPFFLLRNTETVGWDEQGRAVVRADRIDITVEDVIAHSGPRASHARRSGRFSRSRGNVVAPVLHGSTTCPLTPRYRLVRALAGGSCAGAC